MFDCIIQILQLQRSNLQTYMRKMWSHGLTVRGAETNAGSGRCGATSTFSQIGELFYT
jgi:hypothetical protein